MSTLSLMLYPGGNSDGRFLPILIQKTAQDILSQHANSVIEVLPVEVIKVAKQEDGKDIVEAALKAYGRHILVVHKDADACSRTQRKLQSFHPGESLIHKSTQQICKVVIPIIPVKEMEAWMLADLEKLRDVLDIKAGLSKLGLPQKAALVESISDPKAAFKRVIAIAETERRRKFSRDNLYAITEVLAQEIRLEKLYQVPAYIDFMADLKKAFEKLHVLPAT